MDRRRALLGLAGAAVAPRVFARTAAPERARPNILFIMADDLGYADLSCYGRRDYRTPVLDRLAAQGTRLTSAYSNSPVCTATRVALITGRYQYRFPIGLEEPLATRDVGLRPDVRTLPSLLRDAGYATALVGKWHLGELPTYGPLQSGYQQFWGFRGGGVDYFTHAGARQGESDLWDGDTRVETTGYLTTLLGDRAIGVLDGFSRRRAPFLLSLHFSAPHWPWQGPNDTAESARLAKLTGPLAMHHYDGGSLATYAELVTSMDAQIGRVLATLERLGLAENTIVVFTSDNGGERFSDTWPFSGRKFELLEGGIRVPAIVRWPGRVRAGGVSDAQLMSMDWMPTFLAAAGVTSPEPLDGIDVSPALRGGALPERTLYWRYRNLGQQAARRGRYKYLRIGGNEFLFDVEADPLERGNLKTRKPERFAALVRDYDAWNATMLPLDPAATSAGHRPDLVPDRPARDAPPMRPP
jgi:arylsulfatase A-like enzyme